LTLQLRLSSAKPVHVLLGLFKRGPLEFVLDEDSPEWSYASWEGGAMGGAGYVWIPTPLLTASELEQLRSGETSVPAFDSDPGSVLWLTLQRIRRDEADNLRMQALLAVLWELHGRPGAFCLERVAELLHGRRDQMRSRARKTPAIDRLVRLMAHGRFVLDASAKPLPRGAKRPKGDRERYTGTVRGPLLEIEYATARTKTVRLNDQLYQSMTNGPFSVVSAEIFRLDIKGHHNPQGNRPSLASRARIRLGFCHYGRARESAARNGLMQRVRAEAMVGVWAGLQADVIVGRGRMRAFEDALLEEAPRAEAFGGPRLVGLERAAAAGMSMVSLRVSEAVASKLKERRQRHGRHNSRPPVEATRSGAAGSHGPP
jgi:hypothetical protein